ncbi:MAG TPA: flagellar protein FlgN [Syntrophomonadaceae bacterium]|nr:flagellar protein FlgN [Syntrophomonadaceae bacterium]HOQ10641.1 flagellar protein FlgN [Syntrophomonadaceae bacterium]HPU49821.1 flagellar protein FlgN [Syntrophomonadaceae bacterium]
MEGILREFIEVMAKQNQILDQLAVLGEQKQQIIIAGEVKELDSLIQKESGLVAHLEKLESQRFKLQQKLNRSETTARELVEWVGQEYPQLKEEFQETVDRLSYNLDRLKVINKHNNELIEQSLQYIESIQALLNGDIAGTYTDRGDLADEKTGRRINLLDTRA